MIATNRVERHTKINDLKVNMAERAALNKDSAVWFLHCIINSVQNNVLTFSREPGEDLDEWITMEIHGIHIVGVIDASPNHLQVMSF